MILLVGATGVLGQETARQLTAVNQSVRAMTRTPEKATDLKDLGAEVVHGDLTDLPSLARACNGVEIVIASAHSLFGRGKNRSENVDDQGHRDLIDAAKKANVRQFVYISAYGASPDHPVDFYRSKYRVEQYLQHSGLTYTILRPGAFMEWHAHRLLGKGILDKGKTTILGKGDLPVSYVAAHDIAQLIVMALDNPTAYSRIINVGGPTNPSRNDVAALYGRLASVTPKVNHISPGTLRFLSKVIKPFHPGIGRVMFMSATLDAIDQSLDMTETLRDFPIPLTSIEAFVQKQIPQAR